jgi:hypothetical protein
MVPGDTITRGAGAGPAAERCEANIGESGSLKVVFV